MNKNTTYALDNALEVCLEELGKVKDKRKKELFKLKLSLKLNKMVYLLLKTK